MMVAAKSNAGKQDKHSQISFDLKLYRNNQIGLIYRDKYVQHRDKYSHIYYTGASTIKYVIHYKDK